MADIANLLDKDGRKFKAKINKDPVSGEVCAEGSSVFLLHGSNIHSGGTPSNMRGYKYSWLVHSGDSAGLKMESVTDFELVDDKIPKFPAGTRVKLASKFTGTTTKFQFGGDITTVPSEYGVIASNSGWYESYKSCEVIVRWDKGSAADYTNYSMLESELESCSTPEKEVPRDIPGIQKFKVGDLIRVKAGIKEFIFGGAARGTSGDYGKVTSTGGFNHDKKCMTVFVKFNDSRNYTMSEDELEFAPEVPTREIHTFVKGDVIKWHDTLWYVTDADCSGIIVESESGQKNTFLTADQKELEFVKSFRPELINIRCGMYLKVEKLVNWSMNSDVHCPVGTVKSGDIIRVFDIGNLKCIATAPFRPFLFEFNEKKWGGCLSAENQYSISSSSCSLAAHLSSKPDAGAIYDGNGIMDRIEYSGLHISPVAAPDWVEAYAREMYYYKEREAAKKRAVDPTKEREKYISGVDPFDKPPAPTKDLEIKKQKKFSL